MDAAFNMHKIRYMVLEDLFKLNHHVDMNKPVDLFINLDMVIRRLINPKLMDSLKINRGEKYIRFVSNVINLAAHYKGFFIKRGINVNIYIYSQYPFNSDTQINRKYNNEYRMYSEYRITNESSIPLMGIIDDMIPCIVNVVSYIPNVYFIKSENIESSLIPMIIGSDNGIILTDDIYDFQYVNYGFHVLVPQQTRSILLSEDNIMGYICYLKDVKLKKNLNPKFIPFILSMYGSKCRNIYKIKGFGMKTIFKALEDAITRRLITPNTTNIELLLEVLKSNVRKDVEKNFYCTDIDHQFKNLSSIDISTIRNQIVDRYSPPTLNMINNKYFELHPLQLIELTSEIVPKQKIQF